MATYLVDYENVKTGGLNGISLLSEEDRVIIFYSENANRLTFDLHQRLTRAKATVEYREVLVGGHNALDFQLVTYLGYLLASDPEGHYLIISNDRGFEYVVNFWRKEGKRVGLLSYLKDPSIALMRAMQPKEPVKEVAVTQAEEPDPIPEVTFTSSEEEEVPAAEEETNPVPEVSEPEAVTEPETVTEPEPIVVTVKASKPKNSRSRKKAKAEPKSAEKEPEVIPAPQSEEPSAPAPKPMQAPTEQAKPVGPELRTLLGDSVADDIELRFVSNAVEKYKTKLGLNNALVKKFGNQKAGEIYQKLKPTLSFKKAK